ncbi:hypothetical protein [Deefgea piscis]|uniref:hypothetical protein n=1 Tax=Deefgea piscis TaxID=2739061 RepID=UPI001C7EF108|nr:hypothetical protein [Deefgea piscis]QZA80198.1 hypothetical protein K4H25_11710 [Deefgea piscis]
MKFEQKGLFYAESLEGYRLVKHIDDGVPMYAAWHPRGEWLAFNQTTAKAAAAICREHWEKGCG